jgi:ATP-dependent Clp protease ATP-binding subunit ClpA
MTSNAGTTNKGNGIGFGKSDYDSLSNMTKDALKEYFRPEFINRIDETIVFTKLSKDELFEIADLMILDVVGDAKEKGIGLEVTANLKAFLLEEGYDEKFGARPLRRTIQRYVEDDLAERYIKNEILEGDSVTMDYVDGKVIMSHQ